MRRPGGLSFALPLTIAVVLAGCSAAGPGRGAGPDPFSGGVARGGSVTILADNDNRMTAILAVLTPGGTRVLGQVTPRETEFFSFELEEEAEVRVLIELQTGENYRTSPSGPNRASSSGSPWGPC